MTQTADRYGKVLYDLRVPAEDVEQMKAALCAAPQLVKILNDPTLTKEVKHEIIETIFPKSLHNFLKTVSDRRRCDQYRAIHLPHRRSSAFISRVLRQVSRRLCMRHARCGSRFRIS